MAYTPPAPATDGITSYTAARDAVMNAGIFDASQVADDALSASGDAQTSAEGALSAAQAAQGTADAATTAAAAAQGTATSAATAAGTAQTTAGNAGTAAAAAQGTANTGVTNAAAAQATANTGVTNAATAQGTANTALTNAATAQTTANNAATAAGAANTGVTALNVNRATYKGAAPHIGPAFLALATSGSAQLAIAKANGMTHAHVQVFWDACQPAQGGAVSATATLAEITAALANGLKVCLEVSLQYPPAWASTLPRLIDQDAASWSGAQGSGDDIHDWVWNAAGRAAVADFLDKLFVQLDWSKIERVRIGGMTKGELQFPPSISTKAQWWAYSTAAQGTAALAPRMAAAPTPGYKPTQANSSTGASNGWTDNDTIFQLWYQQSLINYMSWLIERHRRWFDGPVYVLHPGSGWRRNSQVMTSTTQAFNGSKNLAAGLDWHQTLASYPDDLVWPYSTWIDGTYDYAPAYASRTNDGNASAWLYLRWCAEDTGRAGGLWGENTGGQSNADMDRVFNVGALTFGYNGMAWLNHTSLAGNAAGQATYAHFLSKITAFIA